MTYFNICGWAQRLRRTSSAKARCQNGLSPSKNFTSNDKNISHSVTYNRKINRNMELLMTNNDTLGQHPTTFFEKHF